MKKENIESFTAYQLYDSYHSKFYDPKMSLPHKKGGRPHVSTIVDIDGDYAWVIPMSSREDKNGNLKIKEYLEKRKHTDMVSVIKTKGITDYYIIENAIPVPFEYIKEPHFRGSEPLRIKNYNARNELVNKLEKIKKLKYQGLLTKGKMDMKLVEEMVKDYMNGYRYSEEDIQFHEGMNVENKLQQEKLKEREQLKREAKSTKMKNSDIQIYIYSGFGEPEKVESFEEITVESNHLGDITEEFQKEVDWHMEVDTLEELQENQFFAEYGVWINPTKKQLEEYNDSIGLDKDEYLQDFEGHEQLFEDRETETYLDIDDDFER